MIASLGWMIQLEQPGIDLHQSELIYSVVRAETGSGGRDEDTEGKKNAFPGPEMHHGDPKRQCVAASLRRHGPYQVPRVGAVAPSQPNGSPSNAQT